MQIAFIHDTDSFEALSGEWNDLLSRAATNVPFLRHEYLSIWWSTLGGGEWQEGDLWVGVGRDERGDIVGLAPLFHAKTRDGRMGLMLLGTVEISDYLDFIAPVETMDPFVRALLAALEEDGPDDWDVLDLYNIPERSPSLPALESAALERGWEVSKEWLQPCPVISLEGTWDDYLASLDKKQRHELRRKMRRADQHSSSVNWRIVGSDDDVEKETDRFINLMAFDSEKTKFLSGAMRVQFSRSVRTAHQHGWLHLSFLEAAGETISGILCFDYQSRIWVYNSGMDPAFLALSPGWVSMGYLIRWAIDNGRQEIDFLRGDEKYKYQLGGVEQRIARMTIFR
jgi:CelD/BcsL family acetyltransferase involved in cellulose biosynthesis